MKRLAALALVVACRPAVEPDPMPAALQRAVGARLAQPGDAAAVMRLTDGRLMLTHHPTVLRQRRMMAGSVIKLVSAYALAAAGIDPEYRCTGQHRGPSGTVRACWYRPGHGPLRLRAALAHSCNAWFYAHAGGLSSEVWLRAAHQFGLGRAFTDAGIARDLVPLSIPRPDLPDLAVGDHVSLRVTPLSLLRAVSVVATGGLIVEPSERGLHKPTVTALDVDALRWVAEGMIAAADEGTLAGVFSPEAAAAKTGTAKRYRNTGTRGWVVGFAPRYRPQYAFVVVKDRGRGGPDAGPIAAALVRALAGQAAW